MDIANILRGFAAAALIAAAPAEAASFTWPSPTAPCNGTLQACIDAAPAPSIWRKSSAMLFATAS